MKKSAKLQTILLFMIMGILLFAITVVSVLVNRVATAEIIAQVSEMRQDVLNQVSKGVDGLMQEVERISDFYYDNVTKIEGIDAWKELEHKARARFNVLDIDYKITVTFKTGQTYVNGIQSGERIYEKLNKKIWFSRLMGNNEKIIWYTDWSETKEKIAKIGAARGIYNQTTGEMSGILMIEMDHRLFLKQYSSLLDRNSIYIIDQNGTIISDPDENRIGLLYYNMNKFNEIFRASDNKVIKKSGIEYLYSKCDIANKNWIVIEEIPLHELSQPLIRINQMILVIGVAVLLGGSVITVAASHSLTKPISDVCKKLDVIGQDGLARSERIRLSYRSWKEIRIIVEKFNAMMDRIDNMIINMSKITREKLKTEMSFLQMQIQPHFMYNTLFSVKCMIAMGETDKANKMMGAFLTLIRNILNTPNEMVTIDHEIYIINEFIAIEKFRYGDTFDVVLECPESLKNYKILSLILQPIVENSVIHGVAEMRKGGKIRLKIYEKEYVLQVEIWNNGKPMTPEQIASSFRRSQNGGIGLYNVERRIKLNFGDKYGIKIIAGELEGTTVTVTMPIIK